MCGDRVSVAGDAVHAAKQALPCLNLFRRKGRPQQRIGILTQMHRVAGSRKDYIQSRLVPAEAGAMPVNAAAE